MAKKTTAVPAAALTQTIPAKLLNFRDTSELESFHGVLGQDRAVNAIQFGVAMQRPGYNIFVMGDTGTGRSSQRCCNRGDRKSTRLNSSHVKTSYAVFCLKKKKALPAPHRTEYHGSGYPTYSRA